MGLDMFLDGIKYKSAYQKDKKTGEIKVVGKRQIIKTLEIDWRKSNQIHKWFVDNVQFGNDDCRSYEVSIEQLIELRDTCKNVLENHDLASELLPTQEGCFFGSTNYDEIYFEDLEFTVSKLNELLNAKDQYDWFEYSSSW